MEKLIKNELLPETILEAPKQTNHEYGLKASLLMKPGTKLYQYDPQTEILKLADMSIEIIATRQKGNEVKPVTSKRVNYDPKKIYVVAINLKNAERKVIKTIRNRLLKFAEHVKPS